MCYTGGMSKFYQQPSTMEPLLPLPLPQVLEDLAVEIIRQSAKLGSRLHPLTRLALVELFRESNCYYSNLIEGHKTSPLDIQRALKKDFSREPTKHALQQESLAHIAVQKLIENRITQEPDLDICTPEFICWIHEQFCSRLPTVFLEMNDNHGKKMTVHPGKLRITEVTVGHHIPPLNNYLPQFLNRFSEVYNPHKLTQIMQVVTIAASHHRLAWIHPFLDGNGRVVRLFSDAYFKKAKVDSHGLWTMARGLSRNRSEYMAALEKADAPRHGDLDGRGNLSLRGLAAFCEFFLTIAIDQISFMQSILDLENFPQRIEGYIHYLAGMNQLKTQSFDLLKAALFEGEISRGNVATLTGMPERTARNLIPPLLNLGLLKSTTPKGPLRLGFPIEAVKYYFPALYHY
jgi:Fic family protein